MVGITFQTKKCICNVLAYYHKLLTKLLNDCVVKSNLVLETANFRQHTAFLSELNIAANYLQRCVGRANEY